MNNWAKLAVEEFANVISGATPDTSIAKFWNGKINWITPVDLSKLKTRFIFSSIRKISIDGLNSCATTILPAGSVVMSSRAPIGYFAIGQTDFTTNQGCKSFLFKKKQDSEFHYYSFSFNVEKFKQLGAGSTFAEISKAQIEKIVFDVPPLPEQQKIARILRTVDGQIEKTEAIIAKYKAIKQGLMQDLFTRGIDIATGKLRPSYQETPELYKPSPLGMIPKEWEVVRIDTVANITTGSRDTQDRVDKGEYPFFVRSQKVERINSYSYDGEAILTAGDGVGVGKVYHYYNGKFDFHQRVYMLYEFKSDVDPKFVFEYFKTHFLDEVDKYSAKTTVDSVRMEMIAGMLFVKPKHSEQVKASSILSGNEKLLVKEQIYLAKLQQLKKGLMSDLLSGKVRVQVDQEAVC